MTTRILLSLFIAALFASCSSSGNVANDPGNKRLIFGSGGGFTGIYISYEFHEDGRVFSLLTDSTQTLVKKLRKKQTQNIFEEASRLAMAQPALNHPGNITWFIKYQSAEGSTEYKWGDTNVTVPGEIKDFYSQLNAIVK
jgi:hypothetical protein